MSLREEFRLKNLGFSGVSQERFYTFQWRLPGIVYLIYRVTVAAFTFAILSLTAYNQFEHPAGGKAWPTYLTNWTYTVLTLYFVSHAIVSVIGYTVGRNEQRRFKGISSREHVGLFHELQNGREDLTASDMVEQQSLLGVVFSQRTSPAWYHMIVWILFNVASTASLMVTLVFWSILVPESSNDDMAVINHDNLELHLVNSCLVFIEHFMTAVPIRLLHVIYPFTYGLVYMFFSLFYWVDDHSHIMYNILDWGKPGPTVGYVCLVGFVVIPLLHLLIYALYRLKLKLFSVTVQY